jgi:hypothetical protein
VPKKWRNQFGAGRPLKILPVDSQLFTDRSLPDEPPAKDKAYRRYASGVERSLSLFDTNLQEWADYISFLGRLLKVFDLPETRILMRY